jgi:hypothetical protein
MKKLLVAILAIILLASTAMASNGDGKKKAKKKARTECTKSCTKTCDPKHCDPKNCDPQTCQSPGCPKEQKCSMANGVATKQ